MSFRDRHIIDTRPRWPAQFDIEGIPRERKIREERKLELLQQEEPAPMPQNEFDVNKPAKLPYVHQDYPRMLYKGAQHLVVNDAAAEKKAMADGYAKKPDAKKLQAERARQNRRVLTSPALAEGLDEAKTEEVKPDSE